MLVPLSWLHEYVDVDLPTPALAERLSLAGLEVEAVDKVGADEVLNIAITPDAARALSIIGVAREVAAILDQPLKLPADEFPASGDDRAEDLVNVSIEDPALCSRYIGVVIKDVQIRESPQWMKDRLERAGIRPVSNVVDVTNYVMLEMGQPLHAFDLQTLQLRAGNQVPHVMVRPARSGEKMKTLDGADRTLDPSMLMICDARGPIAVAGVMGGADSEISSLTRDLLLESANFDKTSVRRTAQKLKMSTEASFRFTRGIPSRLAELAAHRAAKLIVELSGGRIVPGIVDRYPVPQEQPTVYLTPAQVQRTLGLQLTLEQIAQTLTRLEFVVQKRADVPPDAGEGALALFVDPKQDVLKCAVPWYRLDVRIPADLTEEIARMHGFDRIETSQLSEPLPPPLRNQIHETEEKIRDILVGCGLQETINYSLTTPQQHERLGVADTLVGSSSNQQNITAPKYITLANAMSADRTVMRRSLLVSAIENLAHNIRFTNRLMTFEIGRVYLPEQSADGIRPMEDHRVSLLMTGPRREAGLNTDPAGLEPMDFFDLKGVIEALLSRLGVAPLTVRFVPYRQDKTFTPRCARVMLGETELGIIGEMNPAALSEIAVKLDRVVVAELRINALIQSQWDWSRTTTVNKFPAVVEDLAFIVDESAGAGEIRSTLMRAGGGHVVEVDLFDVFRGQSLEAGKKSVAYRVSYQDPNSALTNDQAVAVRNTIVQAVASEHRGVLRAI